MAATDRYRGVRQMTFSHPSEALAKILPVRIAEGILASEQFVAGFRHVASRKLVFDATVFHTQLPEVAALADAFPDTMIVLNHLGMAMAYGLDQAGRADVFETWRGLMSDLARRPNVVCKIGGLGMPFWGFGFEARKDVLGYAELAAAWAPYIEAGIATFGVDRCLMESNFPLEGISCGYVPLWNAMKHVVRGYSAAEKAALFRGTAARVYGVAPSEG
jgi:predicted TIM-barrel fold metal-dependent hydrolase